MRMDREGEQEKDQTFQILSLDGGGVKGLFSAAVLSQLESDLRIRVVDHFDLIVGTSTGGLIALALGLGLPLRDVVEFYVEDGPKIFRDPLRFATARRLWAPKFGADALGKALRRRFGGATLGESSKRLVIASYSLADDDVYLFRTPHHERLRRDYRVEMWQVGMATAAAPTYFPAFREVDRIPLVDGGVWANNPSMVGVIEAAGTLEIPVQRIRLFSLGTSQPVKRAGRPLERGGLWHWAFPSSDVFLRGQALCATNQARHLLGAGRVLRLDPIVPDRAFRLDSLDLDGLMGMAAHESRKASPDFERMFMGHTAPAYRPFHVKETVNGDRVGRT